MMEKRKHSTICLPFLRSGKFFFQGSYTLFLTDFLLPEIPNSILEEATNLRKLNLSGNSITLLTSKITEFTKLSEIYFDRGVVPDNISILKEIKSLKELHLTRCNLREIPEAIFELANIEKLVLDENQIDSIPDDILKLKKLSHLSVKNNRLEDIPRELFEIKSLNKLELDSNNLQTIPQLTQKSDLFHLSLKGNRIISLTISPDYFANLGYLELSNNEMTENSVTEVIYMVKKLGNIRELNLIQQGISSFPEPIKEVLLFHPTLQISDLVRIPECNNKEDIENTLNTHIKNKNGTGFKKDARIFLKKIEGRLSKLEDSTTIFDELSSLAISDTESLKKFIKKLCGLWEYAFYRNSDSAKEREENITFLLNWEHSFIELALNELELFRYGKASEMQWKIDSLRQHYSHMEFSETKKIIKDLLDVLLELEKYELFEFKYIEIKQEFGLDLDLDLDLERIEALISNEIFSEALASMLKLAKTIDNKQLKNDLNKIRKKRKKEFIEKENGSGNEIENTAHDLTICLDNLRDSILFSEGSPLSQENEKDPKLSSPLIPSESSGLSLNSNEQNASISSKKISAFLSHSSTHKELVYKFAEALARRGIEPWLDIHSLYPRMNLDAALTKSIEEQTFFIIFLSKEVLDSYWVKHEFEQAIALEKMGKSESIIPIFMERLDNLGAIFDLLPDRWKNQGRKQLNRLGVEILDENQEQKLDEIALKCAESFYNKMALKEQKEVNLVFDQRGKGDRYEAYQIPESLLHHPTLIFRHDLRKQTEYEVLLADEWKEYISHIEASLDKAFGGEGKNKLEKVHIHGAYQPGLAYFLGKYFNSTSQINLQVYRSMSKASNEGWKFSDEELTFSDEELDSFVNSIPELSQGESGIAFYLGRENGENRVRDYLNTQIMHRKLIKREAKHIYKLSPDQSDIINLIRKTLQELSYLVKEFDVQHIQVFFDLPNNILSLLSAELHRLAVNIEFMEWNQEYGRYSRLPMKLDSRSS